ncbi:MAG: sugar phosphate isomerase/epimerase [Clostridiales bacterium]|nr:sugar phosphate isomerase/epimerase [Clostridiales bacterium]
MVRLGICGPIENIEAVAKIGYDYLETGLIRLYEASDEEFAQLCARVDNAPIKVEVFNGMLPGTLKVVGKDVNAQALHAYLDKAFSRASRLGAKVIVFGSGGARNVPEGFPVDMAWRQICNFLRIVERHAMDHNLIIAIEPLRRAETNMINLVSEAVALTSILQLNHIRALGDTYHMAFVSEPTSVFTLNAHQIAHVHTANPLTRACPKEGDGEDYAKILQHLKDGGYNARVSIEAFIEPYIEAATDGFACLDAARKAVWTEE